MLCTAMLGHPNAMHSYAMHSYAKHSYAMHSYAMHSYAKHSYAMHSYAMHSYAMHSYTKHSYAMHSYTKHHQCLCISHKRSECRAEGTVNPLSNYTKELHPDLEREACENPKKANGAISKRNLSQTVPQLTESAMQKWLRILKKEGK